MCVNPSPWWDPPLTHRGESILLEALRKSHLCFETSAVLFRQSYSTIHHGPHVLHLVLMGAVRVLRWLPLATGLCNERPGRRRRWWWWGWGVAQHHALFKTHVNKVGFMQRGGERGNLLCDRVDESPNTGSGNLLRPICVCVTDGISIILLFVYF